MTPQDQYRVQVATYNGHLAQDADLSKPENLAAWLVPTLNEGSDAYPSEGEPPDFFAIGFQEMIPLHLSLLGFTATALKTHDDIIRGIIESHAEYVKKQSGKEKYTLLAKKALGGIALLVYARDQTVTEKVTEIDIATAACGVFNVMGNKGAVGARITVEETNVFTFVAAHLAAHDSGLERRNADYRNIVERLIFDTADNSAQYQIYDTSYLFFFGDLNYRIAGKAFTTPELTELLADNDLEKLYAHDQLKHEQAEGKTLQHLKEGPITFRPTYKYLPGKVDEFSDLKKRVPGWCDRILFATWADASSTTTAAEVELYRSVMSFTQSDHKPVTSIVLLPPCDRTQLKHLPFDTPYVVNESYKSVQWIGWALDRTVGFIWTSVHLAGFGKDERLGLITIGAVILAAWYYH